MASKSRVLYALTALAVGWTAGCALTSKSEPVLLRYFTPERPARSPDMKSEAPTGSLELRLGRVNAASYIKDRIAYRDAALEVFYYEELRWTEKPEAYLRRAASHALFEEQGVRQLLAGHGPTLELELEAFEEVRAPKHVARVQITWLLRDETVVHAQRTFTVEHAIANVAAAAAPNALAEAMAQALDEAVQALTRASLAELAKTPPAPADASRGGP